MVHNVPRPFHSLNGSNNSLPYSLGLKLCKYIILSGLGFWIQYALFSSLGTFEQMRKERSSDHTDAYSRLQQTCPSSRQGPQTTAQPLNSFVPNLTVLIISCLPISGGKFAVICCTNSKYAGLTQWSWLICSKICRFSFLPAMFPPPPKWTGKGCTQLIAANLPLAAWDHKPQLKEHTAQFLCSKPHCTNICKLSAYFRWQVCCNQLYNVLWFKV